MTIANEKSMDYAVKMRLLVVDSVMKCYTLGKYAKSGIDMYLKGQSLILALEKQYKLFLEHPKKIGVEKLLEIMLSISDYIENKEFESYKILIKLFSVCRKNIHSTVIPDKHASGVITDFRYLCLIRQEFYFAACRALLASGIKEYDFVKALDIPRQFGDITKNTAVISVGAAINNAIHLIFKLMPAEYIEDQDITRPQVSQVTGAVMFSVEGKDNFGSWIKSEVGYSFEGRLVTDPTLSFL